MAKMMAALGTAVCALVIAPLSPHAAAVSTGGRQTVARSEPATVKVTYQGGDAAAGPQTMTGRDDATGIFLTAIHTVNIDFAKFITDACVGDRALAARLHKMNPISAIHVLELNTVDPATSGARRELLVDDLRRYFGEHWRDEKVAVRPSEGGVSLELALDDLPRRLEELQGHVSSARLAAP